MDTLAVEILNQLASKPDKLSFVERLYDKAAFSWSEFVVVGAILLMAYLSLRVLQRFLSIGKPFGQFQRPIRMFATYFLLVFEPIVILLLSSAFLLINPIYHGLLMGMIMMFAYAHMKNYVNGRIVQFNSSFSVGSEIEVNDLSGIISNKSRLGVQIKTGSGVHFVSFSHIIKNGYMLLSGNDISGFYELLIVPNKPNDKYNYELQLMDLLSSVPYLDWNHKPEITINDDYEIKIRVIVKDENHLNDLVTLIKGWDYSCKAVN